MIIERLKQVRDAINKEEREFLYLYDEKSVYKVYKKQIPPFSIMRVTDYCGTPSCIAGHAKNLGPDYPGMELNDEVGKAAIWLDVVGHDIPSLFCPRFEEFANLSSMQGEKGFITKDHVLRTLDLIIKGETDYKKAWKDGRPNN